MRQRSNAFVVAAEAIETAIDRTLADGGSRTQDLGGTLSTGAYTSKLIANLA